MPDTWKLCSSCKKPIPYRAEYYVCSVSTCNRKRTGYQFCSVECWDAHVPVMNHRNAWAEDRIAPPPPSAAPPPTPQPARRVVAQRAPQKKTVIRPANTPRTNTPGSNVSGEGAKTRTVRRVVRPAGTAARRSPDLLPADDSEILVIASRLKQYIRDRSGGMNTSAEVLEALSDLLRERCDEGIRRAREDGRKTLKARDLKKSGS